MNPSPVKPERHGPLMLLVEKITSQSYQTLFMLWLGMAFGFALAYFALSSMTGTAHHGPILLEQMEPLDRFFNALYYSIITATSPGYGDIVPQGFSKFLASIQSMLALFIFAVFVTKLVSHRQELALREVHKLTFEDIFHNTREDLFLMRKDLDTIIDEAKETGELSEIAWKNLTTVFRQAQTLVSEIPDFYGGGNAYYNIDSKREELLIESVQRTLHRINQTMDVLSQQNIDWESEGECVTELKQLINVINETMPVWRSRSPYKKQEAFEDILQVRDEVHAWVEKAI